jgi:hypothetical protein
MGEVLERATQRAKRKRSSIGTKLVNWFKNACGALATVLGLGATLANILCQPHIGAGLGAGSALCKKLESALGKISKGMWPITMTILQQSLYRQDNPLPKSLSLTRLLRWQMERLTMNKQKKFCTFSKSHSKRKSSEQATVCLSSTTVKRF